MANVEIIVHAIICIVLFRAQVRLESIGREGKIDRTLPGYANEASVDLPISPSFS